MAESSSASRKAVLVAQLNRARADFHRSSQGFRSDLRIRPHAQQAFERNTGAWLGGAAILGWILAKLPARKEKVKVFYDSRNQHKVKVVKKAGFFMAIVKLVLGLLKPTILAYATKKLADFGKSTKDAVETSEHAADKSEDAVLASQGMNVPRLQ